jgi:enamine deaminase RidA (YjgF/YER057c/UK114 family)
MPKQYHNPDELPNWGQTFTQVVIAHSPATTVYISGQVAVDAEKTLIGGDDLGQQAMRAFHNLRIALSVAGAMETDVVKLTIYIKNYKPADADAVLTALRTYFPQKELPTSTWLGVQSLADERFLIEIDAIAVIEHSH